MIHGLELGQPKTRLLHLLRLITGIPLPCIACCLYILLRQILTLKCKQLLNPMSLILMQLSVITLCVAHFFLVNIYFFKRSVYTMDRTR